MKIVRFRLKPEAETFYGVLDGLSIKRLSAEPYDGLHFTGDEYAADRLFSMHRANLRKLLPSERIIAPMRMKWAKVFPRNRCFF